MPFKTPLGERAGNQVAPSFIRPLQDKRVIVGQSVKLECQIDGHPDPVIKWLKDGNNVSNCPDYELAQNGKKHSLLIASAQGADCGRFTIQAMNSAGIKQSTCLLIVAPAPTPLPGYHGAMSIASSPVPATTPIGPNAPFFLKELRNQLHKPSNAVVFEARVVAVPPPEIVWLKDNEPLNNYRAKTEYDPQSGIALLTIPQVFPEDLAEYTCRASNQIGTTECSAFILGQEAYENWLSNEKTSFYREKKQRMIARNQQQQYQSSSHQHRATPQQKPFQSRGLLSPNLSDTDTAWNFSESETEPELLNLHLHAQRRDFVGVPAAPSFRTELRGLKLTEGTDAVLQCQVTGNPKPQIYWLKNGRLMQPQGTPRIQFTYKGSTVILKILEVIQSDSGEYKLCLENSSGKAENAARLEVFPLHFSQPEPPKQPEKAAPPATAPKPQVRTVPERQPQQQAASVQPQRQVEYRRQEIQQRPQELVQAPRQVEYRRQEQSVGRPVRRQQPEVYYTETFRTSSNTQPTQPTQTVRPIQQQRQPISQVQPVTQPQPVQRRQPPVDEYHHYTEPVVVRSQQPTVYRTQLASADPPHYAKPYQPIPEEHFYSAPLVEERRQRQPDQFPYQQYLDQLEQLKGVNHQRNLDQRPSEAIDEFLNERKPTQHLYLQRPQQVDYELQQQRELQNRQFYPQEYRHNRMAPVQQAKAQPAAAVNGNAAGKAPPQFSQMPQSAYVNAGDKASFTAKAGGQPTPTLEWSRNGKVLNDPKKYQISGKDGQSQLTINQIADADYGTYVCTAANPSGRFQAQFQVANPSAQSLKRKHDQSDGDERERVTLRKVDRSKQLQNSRLLDDLPPPSKEPPKFQSQLKSLTLNEGQHALLDCKFGPTDDANLKVAWLLNGKAIIASSRISTLTEFGYTVLEINPVTVFDHGEYTVVAVNQLGEARQSAIVEVVGHRSDSVNAYLQRTQRETSVPVPAAPQKPIVDRPNFHQEIRSQELFEGQPIYLETKLTPLNDGSMKVTFLLNGSPIKGGDRVQTQFQAGFVVLSIDSATAQDAGEYTILAENEAGQAETSATIIVASRVDNMEASQIYDVDDAREIQFSQNAGQISAPRFLQPIRDYHCEYELGRSYFDARYEPVNDSTVRVEWLKDGNVLANANRIQFINNFGFVSLTIHPTYPEDQGTYTCRITNALGQTESSATLTAVAPEGLQLDSMHESALQQINDIEGFEVHIGPLPVERPEEETSIEAPRFSRPLGGRVEANQEEAVHFEARVLPANDIKMRVEWFKDGAPLPAAHRYRPSYDFGYIALDILYCYPEDSGTYTCVVTNELGQVESSVGLSVTGAETLYLEPQHPEGLERIAELDQPKIYGIQEVPDRESDNPPSFLSNLQDIEINEHEDFLFDLKISPANDPTTTIEWTVNGQPLYNANRFRPLFEFDRVQLRVKGAIAEDSGTYVCTARNALGETSTSCNVNVVEQGKILSDTQHDQSLSKIEYLESLNKYAREEVVDFQPDTAPQFIQPLPGNLGEVEEGEFLHLEAKVEPVGDNTLQVYWLHNGRPLPSAHRLRPFYDFGFVSLDILSVYAEDSGQFTCVAENQHGKAETSVTINCQPKSRILDQTQHEESYRRIQELEAPKDQAPEEEAQPAAAPQFVRPLQGSIQANEGDNLFLEVQYTPIDDNTLTHEWLFNGQPLQKAHRFAHLQDFGNIGLTILYVYPEDSGTYTLVLRNQSGETSSSVDIQCEGQASLLTDTFHESAIGRIAELEAPRPLPEEAPDADKVAPQITKQLEAVPLSQETQSVHLEAQYLPIDDNSLEIEWYRDGAPLPHSNRYKLLKDFGYAALDINFLVAADAGEYTLVVSNELGQAQTSTTIQIEDGAVLLLDSAHPESLRRIIELESVKPAEPEEVELPPEAPQFTQQLTMPEIEEVTEGIPLHMDATLIPVTDNKLTVHWFKDGQPLQFSSRIRNIFEFGYVALEFNWIIAEDSGTYTCVARNEHGEASTSLSFECGTKRNLYLESQHDESWKRIQELENRVVEKEPSPELVFGPPTFTQNLENADEVLEGSSVRLLCRVQPVADPTLKIHWTLNGNPLGEGNRFRHSRNVDLIVLDLVYVLPEDEGLYSCVATSDWGSATTSATVKVQPIDALLLDTQHEKSWQRVQELEAPKPEPEPLPDREKEPPRFTTNLNQVPDLQEGQSAALFATVEPAWDNELAVEWLFNGQPLGQAHRFRTQYALGNIYLNILYAFAADSGTYTAIARNSVGEARSETTIQVAPSDTLYLQPQSEASWAKVQALEAPKEKEAEPEEQPASAPQFIEQLQSLQRIEGQPAHFQTRVTPVNDNKLKIQWLKDGAPLPDANKFKHTYDFGLITLDISHTVANDAGTYSVVASNEQGTAQVDGQLTVEPLGTLLLDPVNQASWQRVQELEAPKEQAPEEADIEYGPPQFTSQLQSIGDLVEGQPVHFEANVVPINDPNLRIIWLQNGREVRNANRFSIRNDFGLVSLDISYVLSQDIGDWTCRAVNNYGQAETTAHLECEKRPNILSDTIHDQSWQRIQEIEAPKEPAPEPEPQVFQPPQFTQPLQSQADVPEGSLVIFEGKLIPVGDPSMLIQWYRDDVPIQDSNRHAISHDFGYVALRINGVLSFDNGTYSCKAVNDAGATISNASLTVGDTEGILGDAINPASFQKIQQLESIDKNARLEVPEQEFGKPVWVKTFENVELDDEGAILTLEGYVDPADDPNLRVEWFQNNMPLQNSNRHRCDLNFGQVVFSIIHVLPHDSGIYTCRAYNAAGEAVTSSTVKVAGYESLLLDTMHETSWQRIQELEAPKIVEEVEIVEEKEKPRFLTHLEDATEVQEGTPIKLEATFQPARDNDLTVEWLFNNQPLGASQLIKTRSELGWASLEINGVTLDHNGVFTLIIRNTEGEAATSATVQIAGIGDILGDTTHPESWTQIQILEAPKEKEPSPPPPVFDTPQIQTQITDIECDEGDASEFQAVFTPTNDPNLKVEWYRNGELLAHGNKFAISNDFGLAKLGIGFTFPEDEGVFQLKISNSAGEAVSSATLKCNPKDALLLDTMHDASWQRIQEIEAPKEPVPEPEPAPKVPPKFTSPLQNVADLHEHQSAHFETTLEPVDDNELTVQWYFNGAPFAASNRAKMIHSFGIVILNIQSVDVRDTGTWECVATNSVGEDRVSSTLNVTGSENIAADTINQQSYQRIQELEGPKEAKPEEEAPAAVAPQITAQLSAPSGLQEGDSVHLQATYTPVNDSNLKVEWLKDGAPLAMANKHKVISNFGFAVLDILYLLGHDAGEYTVRVYNDQGEATSSATIEVGAKESLLLQPIDENKSRAVQELEDARNRRPEVEELAPEDRIPVFVQPLSAPVQCEQGERVHFNAQYEPISDPSVEISWFLNGRPLVNASRMKSLNEFGTVVLEITSAHPLDSGELTCRAKNKSGEAVTSTTLTVTPKEGIISHSQLPEAMSNAQQRIDEIENRRPAEVEEPEIVHGPPRFTSQFQQPPQLREGALFHVDAQLEPVGDNSLTVQWFHNGEPVRDSNRMKAIKDFGFVVLELLPAEPQDTGTWECVASNNDGEARASVNIEVIGDSGISYEWVAPGERRERIDQLEEYINRPRGQLEQPEIDFEAPHFTENLADLGDINETEAGSFICVLEPIGDPTMKVQWLKDGQPLPYSNRFQYSSDFGVQMLLIKYLIAQDSGTYTCIAENSKGRAETSATVNVQTIIQTEEPQIVQPLVETIDSEQGESVHLECRVSPINDPLLKVYWLKDGQPLADANRYKQVNEFGFISFDILYALAEDTGDYELVVENDKGRASTKCHVVVIDKPSLDFSAQAPGSTADNIEHHLRQFTRSPLALVESDAYDARVQRAPEFKTQLLNVGVEEGDYCRFETQVAPFNDPYLKVEWFKDGQPLNIGSRFKSTLEFGFCCLDLLYALGDDTGEYTAVATNKFGQATVSAKLACSNKKDVLTESQIPQGLKVRDLKKKEDNLHWVETTGLQARTKEAPQFTIKPRNVQATEGQPARFECAVSGNPRPKVIWYVNGVQALHGHRYKLNYDGVHYLTISQARISDAGTVEAIARNTEGEVLASTNLDVFQRDDFRQQKLRQAQQKTSDELQQREEQWKVDTLGSLGQAFQQAPKADVTNLLKVERSRHPVEPLETEELMEKFTRPKNEEFYDKLSYVERQRPEFEGLKLEAVSLKPGQIQRYQPEAEQLETVNLRNVQRPEDANDPKRFASPPPDWATGDVKLGEPKGKFNQLDEPERDPNIPARDQIKLRGAKPKPADEKEPIEHVRIEEDKARLRAVQQGPEIEQEKLIPHKDQVQIKQKYQAKPVSQGEHVYVDAGPLKGTPQVVKTELERSTISNKPQPTKMVDSQKAAPVIQNQLQATQGELGRSAAFVVGFGGDGPINVKWFFNGRELRSAFDTQIKTTEKETRLELSKIKENHAGTYMVQLSNAGGQCESSANLTVTQPVSKGSPPEFKQRITDQRAQQNSTIKFTCSVSSEPKATIAWFKDGQPIPNDVRFKADDTEVSLEISDVKTQDAGIYECVAKNPSGESRCKARLNVNLAKTGKGSEAGPQLIAPRFSAPLKPVVANEGSAAEFRAKYTGDPEPMIRWYRNNEPVRPSRGYEVGHSNGECWMKIASVANEHVAEYKCEASNPAGKASSVSNLVIKPGAGKIVPVPAGAVGVLSTSGETSSKNGRPVKAPQILQKLSAINARAGENVKFVLQFDGEAQITWTFNGKPLTGNEFKASVEGNKSILQISKVTNAHTGNYACKLQNQGGSAQSEAKLNVQSR